MILFPQLLLLLVAVLLVFVSSSSSSSATSSSSSSSHPDHYHQHQRQQQQQQQQYGNHNVQQHQPSSPPPAPPPIRPPNSTTSPRGGGGLFKPNNNNNNKKKKLSSSLRTITNKLSSAVTLTNGKNRSKGKRLSSSLPSLPSLPSVDHQIVMDITQNLLAGLASAIALIPEASTFAITAGLSPLVGLGSTIVLAAISGSFGGRPGLVSGASATVSLILKPLQEHHGPIAMSIAVLIAGLLQIGLGLTRCSRYIRVVPKPVMLGFVNGLSIKVIKAQVPHFQHPHGIWLKGRALKYHSILVILSAFIIECLPKLLLSSKHFSILSKIPSPLIALGLASIATQTWELPVPLLIDMVGPEAFEGGFTTLKQAMLPFKYLTMMMTDASSSTTTTSLLSSLSSFTPEVWLNSIIPTAIEMAVVGLLQTLLTLQIIDSKTHTKGKNTQESIAQGMGNIISGSIGGMGGSALLGQSLVNVNSGGTSRVSSISVAIFVLIGVTFCAPVLGQIPVAALVGLMLTIAHHTFSGTLVRDIIKNQIPLVDLLIIGSVTYTTAYVNMAVAVMVGVLASALRFAWQASCNISISDTGGSGTSLQSRHIKVKGPLFFGSTTTFQKRCSPTSKDREIATKFIKKNEKRQQKQKLKQQKSASKEDSSSSSSSSSQPQPPPMILKTGRETVIDFLESQVWDHSAIMSIEALAQEYHELGVTLRLKHLSSDCREKLIESSNISELTNIELDVDTHNDPTYLVGEDPKTTSNNKSTTNNKMKLKTSN